MYNYITDTYGKMVNQLHVFGNMIIDIKKQVKVSNDMYSTVHIYTLPSSNGQNFTH